MFSNRKSKLCHKKAYKKPRTCNKVLYGFIYSTKIRQINASELFIQYRVKPNIIIGAALILALTAKIRSDLQSKT